MLTDMLLTSFRLEEFLPSFIFFLPIFRAKKLDCYLCRVFYSLDFIDFIPVLSPLMFFCPF